MFLYNHMKTGAGKTTTFGMLTGEHAITAGTAYLDGLNIETQLREVTFSCCIISFCAVLVISFQFDPPSECRQLL